MQETVQGSKARAVKTYHHKKVLPSWDLLSSEYCFFLILCNLNLSWSKLLGIKKLKLPLRPQLESDMEAWENRKYLKNPRSNK